MARKDVKIIRVPNTLAQKVGVGEIDEKRIDQAQKMIDVNNIDFAEVSKTFMDQLQNAVKSARQAGKAGDMEELINGIAFPIMNLKANAGVFNYPLITEIGDIVLNFLDTLKMLDEEVLAIADNFYKTVMLILARQMKGPNAPGGKELVHEFSGVCRRYVEKYK